MPTDEDVAAVEAQMCAELGKQAFEANLTDEQFASRVVGLLIQDEGHLNKYKNTIAISMKIFREMERLRRLTVGHHRPVYGEDLGVCTRCGKFSADPIHNPVFDGDIVPGPILDDMDNEAAGRPSKACDHKGYDFTEHGRYCPDCGKLMMDPGD